jgi:hypothetical protein
MKNALGSETSGAAPDSPATCKFKKVLLSGLSPDKNEVEALMKSLEARGATAESRPQVRNKGVRSVLCVMRRTERSVRVP